MNRTYFDEARTLADGDLVEQVETFARHERGATVQLVAHLAELDARGLYLAIGYGSLFTYCREALLLSEHEAYERIQVARAARRYPLALDLLAQGAVNLTTVRLLAPHLTAENHATLLTSACGLSRREVEELVARVAPARDVPTSIRKLPARADIAATSSTSTPAGDTSPLLLAGTSSLTTAPALPPSPAAPITALAAAPALSTVSAPAPPQRALTPLSPDRYKLQVTIGGPTLEKLEAAKDMLRHALPSGDVAQILDRALTALLADLAKKKFAASDRPRAQRPRADHPPAAAPLPAPSPSRASTESRRVSAGVKRAVYRRDGGRCAFRAPTGRRCGERAFLEFHHVDPYAHGGPATVENIELRCHNHNNYEWTRADVRPLEVEAFERARTSEFSRDSVRTEDVRKNHRLQGRDDVAQ